MTNPADPKSPVAPGAPPGPRDRAPAPRSETGAIESFLHEAKVAATRAAEPRGRLVFALDATMSRQPTWDLACRIQGQMFEQTAEIGGLDVQLVYFRGFAECRASRFVRDPRSLTDLMSRIACQGGHTQIRRVLEHVRDESGRQRIGALVYVGDAMEETLDHLCARAGEVALRGVRAFMFQEGHDPAAESAFREVARLTGGAYARFDLAAAGQLAALLRTAATYAAGGFPALERLAAREGGEARRLLGQMGAKGA
jgi:hypothetical protein